MSVAVVRIEWNSVFPWVFSASKLFLSQMFLLMSLGWDKDGPISDGSAQNLVPWVSLQQEHKHQPWASSLSCSSALVPEWTAWAGRGWEISLEAPQQWLWLQRRHQVRFRSGSDCVGTPAAGNLAPAWKWRQGKLNHPVLWHSDRSSSSAHFCGMTPRNLSKNQILQVFRQFYEQLITLDQTLL